MMTYKIGLYTQEDPYSFMLNKEPVYGLAIRAYENGDPYANATVNLGEFIGLKDCAYLDNNNAPGLIRELEAMGVAHDTGWSKMSGFCCFPLYKFDEDWLRSLPEISEGWGYDKYLESYTKAMSVSATEAV